MATQFVCSDVILRGHPSRELAAVAWSLNAMAFGSCRAHQSLRGRPVLLSTESAALFYRAWGALLTWVNEERKVVPPFPPPTPGRPIAPALANQVRKVLWGDDALREKFLAEGAASLGSAERDLIASWHHRVSDDFIIFKHLKKHSIFMGKGIYAVLGIFTPLEEMLPELPTLVSATLLPFRDVIIIDGILETRGPQIIFGGGMKRSLKTEYDAARHAGMVRTRLPFAFDDGVRVPPSLARAPRTGSR